MSRLRRLSRVLGSGLMLTLLRPVPAADKLHVDPQLSPGGRWLAVLLESMRETASTPGDGHRSYRKTGQWLFRVDLQASILSNGALLGYTGLMAWEASQ